jgi:hypothetical protein
MRKELLNFNRINKLTEIGQQIALEIGFFSQKLIEKKKAKKMDWNQTWKEMQEKWKKNLDSGEENKEAWLSSMEKSTTWSETEAMDVQGEFFLKQYFKSCKGDLVWDEMVQQDLWGWKQKEFRNLVNTCPFFPVLLMNLYKPDSPPFKIQLSYIRFTLLEKLQRKRQKERIAFRGFNLLQYKNSYRFKENNNWKPISNNLPHKKWWLFGDLFFTPPDWEIPELATAHFLSKAYNAVQGFNPHLLKENCFEGF